jgi:phage-related protein
MADVIELYRAKLEYDLDSDRALSEVEKLRKHMRGFADEVSTFETEVKDFGTGIALALEEPRRPLRDMMALFRVGLEGIKKGSDGAVGGLSAMSIAASDLIGRVEGMEDVANVIGDLGRLGKTASAFFDRLSGRGRGLAQDMNRVMRMTSELGEVMATQARAVRIAHQDELRQIGERIRNIKLVITEQRNLAAEMEKRITAEQQSDVAMQKRLVILQQSEDLIGRRIDLLVQEKDRMTDIADAAESGSEKQKQSLAKIESMEIRYDELLQRRQRTTQEINEIQEKGAGTESRITKLRQDAAKATEKMSAATASLAKHQEEHNFKLRIQGPLIQNAAKHMQSARTALRHLETGWEATGKIADQRLADVNRGLRLFMQESRRARRAGVELPAAMVNSYTKASQLLDIWNQKAKEQRQEAEKGEKTSRKLTAATDAQATSVEGAAVATDKYAKSVSKVELSSRKVSTSMQNVSQSIRTVSRSFSGVSPIISQATSVVTSFSDQITSTFTRAANLAESGAKRIKVSLLAIGGVLTALGGITLGFLKKTGMLAAEVKTLDVTMRTVARNLAINAGADWQKFTSYVVDLRDNLKGITTREATKAVTSFLIGKLPIDRLNDLATAAKNFGVTVANMSSSQVLGRFNEFIQSGNTALLKAIGIVKTADEMHKDYAKTLGITTKQMTGQQKQLARIEGILGQVALTAGVYGEAMKTAGKQLSSMSRLIETALQLLGERYEPMLARIIMGVNSLLKWFVELPPFVIDAVAAFIKWSAILGTISGIVLALGPALSKLIPIIKVIGAQFARSLPVIFAIGAAIGIVVAAVKLLQAAWQSGAGAELAASLKRIIDMLLNQLKPVLDDIRFWINTVRFAAEELFSAIAELLSTLLGAASEVLGAVQLNFRRAFNRIRDIVNGVGLAITQTLRGITALVRGDTVKGMQFLESAVENVLTSIALLFKNFIGKASAWGWNLVVEFANGITLAASKVLAKVMNWFGSVIGKFLAPGSPPERGPLKFIADWGKGLSEIFLRSFASADFGILRDAVAPIQQALQSAVAAGALDEEDLIPSVQAVRKQMAGLIADFRETGEINEEIMSQMSERLGEGGEMFLEYTRRVLEHQKALKGLEEVQEDYADAQEAGFVPKALQDRLAAAEEEVSAAEEAVNWQKEYVAALQETSDLQLEQLALLERMAKAMEKGIDPAKMGGAIGKAVGAAIEEAMQLDFPDIGAESIFTGFEEGRARIGQVSQEFIDMRDRVREVIQSVKDWIALPFNEKILALGEWLTGVGADFLKWAEDVTGLDFSKLAEDIGTFGEEALGWLEKITGWDISEWGESIKKAVGDAWDWIVEKAKWLYEQLVGESYIPDTVNETITWFEKLETWFANSKIGKFIDKIVEVFEAIAGVVASIGAATAIVAIIAAIANFGTIVAAVAGPLVSLYETVVLLGLVFGEVAGAITATLAPVIAIVAAVVAAIALLAYGIWSNREQLVGIWQSLKEEFMTMWNLVKPALADIWDLLRPILTGIGIGIAAVAGFIGVVLVSAIQALWDLVVTALPYIQRIFSGVFTFIHGLIQTFILPIFYTLIGVLNLLTGNNEEAAQAFQKAWENIKEGVKNVLDGLWTIISELFLGILDSLGAFISSFIEHFVEWLGKILEHFGIIDEETREKWEALWSNVWEKVKTTLEQIWEIIKFFGEDFIEWISDLIEGIIQWFKDLYDALIGKSIITDLVEGILGLWEDLVDGTVEWFQDLYDAIVGKVQEVYDDAIAIAETFVDIGTKIVENIVAGVNEKIEWAKTQIKEGWDKIKETLPFSEPKDRTSPLYGLGKAGEAIMSNIVEGMGNFDVSGAVGAQLGNITAQLATASPTNNYNRQYNIGAGAIQASFPGVTRGIDAGNVMGVLQGQVDTATQMGHFRPS